MVFVLYYDLCDDTRTIESFIFIKGSYFQSTKPPGTNHDDFQDLENKNEKKTGQDALDLLIKNLVSY